MINYLDILLRFASFHILRVFYLEILSFYVENTSLWHTFQGMHALFYYLGGWKTFLGCTSLGWLRINAIWHIEEYFICSLMKLTTIGIYPRAPFMWLIFYCLWVVWMGPLQIHRGCRHTHEGGWRLINLLMLTRSLHMFWGVVTILEVIYLFIY